MGYDQTLDDADKNFGAIIRVDSITTGEYNSITVGNTCYNIEELDENKFIFDNKLRVIYTFENTDPASFIMFVNEVK